MGTVTIESSCRPICCNTWVYIWTETCIGGVWVVGSPTITCTANYSLPYTSLDAWVDATSTTKTWTHIGAGCSPGLTPPTLTAPTATSGSCEDADCNDPAFPPCVNNYVLNLAGIPIPTSPPWYYYSSQSIGVAWSAYNVWESSPTSFECYVSLDEGATWESRRQGGVDLSKVTSDPCKWFISLSYTTSNPSKYTGATPLGDYMDGSTVVLP